MSYVLGDLVPLVGGGYVTVLPEAVSVNGASATEFLVQRYDASRHAVGAAFEVTRAAAAASPGDNATAYNFDLVAKADGGFDVAWQAQAVQWDHSTQLHLQGATFDANGAELSSFDWYDPDTLASVAPHIVPLLSGDTAVQQDWSLWIFDAKGAFKTQIAFGLSSNIQVRDFGTYVDVTGIDVSGRLLEAHAIAGTGLFSPSTQMDTIAGPAGGGSVFGGDGPDSVTGGAGADTISGGHGFDVLTGGGGADRFQLWLDGSADRITDFDNSQDVIQLIDFQGLAVASNASAVLTFDARSGLLTWDSDGPGPYTPLVVGALDGVAKITGSNLVGGHPGKIVSLEASGAKSITLYSNGDPTILWSTTHFDAQGRANTFAQQMTDGTYWKNWYDVAGDQPWQQSAAHYDAAGNVLLYEARADDGTLTVYTLDPSNQQVWDRLVDLYDVKGRLVDRAIVADDGSHLEITWDVDDKQPWDHEVQAFDVAGKLLSTTFYNANGSIFS
jgi:hypothetical protein